MGLNTVEYGGGSIDVLVGGGGIFDGIAGSERIVNLGVMSAVESSDGSWGNGSGEAGISTLNANGLGHGFEFLGSVVDELILHGGVELDVSRLINTAVEIVC